MDDDEVDDLLRRSVALAKGAGDAFVAASVGPFGAVRADGSEYTGAYDVDVETLRTFHRRRLEVLADAGADALAIETIPSRLEVQALAAELDRLGRPDLPVWISLSAASSGFVGADLAAALADAAEVAGVVAVGVNCCPPEAVAPALAAVPSGVAGIAYPNSGERWDAEARTWVGEGVCRPRWRARGSRPVPDSSAVAAARLRRISRRWRRRCADDHRAASGASGQTRPLRRNARERPSSSIAAVT